MDNIKFDFEDITIVPAVLSDIVSRKDINLGYLPLIVAPMDMVVDKNNVELFLNNGYGVCMPRGEEVIGSTDKVFHSFGLDEIIEKVKNKEALPHKVLIDIAHGHMRKLYDVAFVIKSAYPNIELMVGNIANPETYRAYAEIGVDYIRVGIGGGSACTTSANTGIHYPMASLINECYNIACSYMKPPKIVADGGFKKYDDIIKAIALGADYVMVGGLLSKTIEACSDNFIKVGEEFRRLENQDATDYFNEGGEIYKYYRGMSTKEVQAKWGKVSLKTAEGISKYNKVDYTLAGWTENFVDYLKSNMSYCNKVDLNSYKGEVKFVHITENAKNRFRK